MATERSNPRIDTLPRAMIGLVALILVVGSGLFFALEEPVRRWPWLLTPFNTRFLGALYLAELAAAFLMAIRGRWSPARIGLWQSLVFTVVVTGVSLFYLDRFAFDRAAGWLWFILYSVPAVTFAYYLWRYRGWPPAEARAVPSPWRAYMLAQATVLALYGLGLLVAPRSFSDFWPWPLDAFHGRVYSAIFVTGATGSYLLSRVASPAEYALAGVTQLVLGLFAILGLLIVDRDLNRVDWGDPGTWLWVGAFAVVGLGGAAMLLQARAATRLPVLPLAAEDGTHVPAPASPHPA